jgi:hypothetical protein
MTRIVNQELEHIPRTGRHVFDAQARLRMLFNGLRREDLKLGKTKEETLVRCIQSVKKDYPTWEPAFDRAFFCIQEW